MLARAFSLAPRSGGAVSFVQNRFGFRQIIAPQRDFAVFRTPVYGRLAEPPIDFGACFQSRSYGGRDRSFTGEFRRDTGRQRGNREKKENKLSKKELAGIGSPFLLNRWQKAFKRYGVLIAQIWITYANWLSKKERVNIKNAISKCLKNGVVPVINENDVVADDEVRSMERGISENDRLARMVALLTEADAVLFNFFKKPMPH